MELNESELIQACLRQDKKAWDLFVERYSKLVYWSARKTLGAYAVPNREECVQEVFQDVFEKLIVRNKLAELRNAPSVRKFLTVMACHAALDRVKSQSRGDKRSLPLEAPGVAEAALSENPVSQMLRSEAGHSVESALRELSPKERVCVELYYFEDLKCREIGEMFGLSEDAVWTILRRTKEKIKTRLKNG